MSYPIVRESEMAEREEIAGWLSGGESMARIGKEMGIPYSRVRRIAAELKAEGMVVERRSKRLAINDEATINEVWDEWHYAYAEVRARYGVNQRIIAAIYKARGIPSQTMPFPVAWEDLRCKELPSKGFKENCATVEREVDEWLQTLLGD